MNTDLIRERALHGLYSGAITQQEYDLLIGSLDAPVHVVNVENTSHADAKTTAETVTTHTSEKASDNKVDENNKKTSSRNVFAEKTAAWKNATTRFLDEKTTKASDFFDGNKHNAIIATVFLIAIFGIIISIMSTNGGLSGFAVFDIPEQNYTGNMSVHATEPFTSIKISGTLFGEGNATIYYITNTSTLIIGTITSDDGTPRTTKASYAAGEEVTIEHLPTSYNAYLDDGITNTQTIIPFAAPANDMTLLLIANESDNLTTYRVPIIIGTTDRTTTFENLCQDTCTMPAATGDLVIETTGTAQVSFSSIETTLPQNSAPTPLLPFDTVEINAQNETNITIDLGAHFVDADGDTLYYSTENTIIATLNVNGNTLAVTPLQDGTDSITIYASDLKEIAIGTLQITVSGITASASNTTTNDTFQNNITNTTVDINTTTQTNTTEVNTTNTNTTSNDTTPINDSTNNITDNNSTNITGLDCSNPDPNARPVACLYQDIPEYFPDQEILLENRDREVVGRFTSIGNLLVKGDIIEHSTASPGSRDWRVAYVDRDGNEHATIWIDSATGDLHLVDVAVEENTNLDPPAGSYSLINKRSIYLAWADTSTGTLHIRGNIIPFRRTLSLSRSSGGGTV
jgi:hypothetical protein